MEMARIKSISPERNIFLAYRAILLVQHFFCDMRKTKIWFEQGNPMLGGVRPIDMVLTGRADKLFKIIDNLLQENTPGPRKDQKSKKRI